MNENNSQAELAPVRGMTGSEHTPGEEGSRASQRQACLSLERLLPWSRWRPNGNKIHWMESKSSQRSRGSGEHGANQRKSQMERCHSKGKNSQEGFACCSDSRSAQNVFPFLPWKNADFTCLGIHCLAHCFIPDSVLKAYIS